MVAVRSSTKLWRVQCIHRMYLLVFLCDWNKAHVQSDNRFADRCGIGRVVLATLAAQAVRDDEPESDQFDALAAQAE